MNWLQLLMITCLIRNYETKSTSQGIQVYRLMNLCAGQDFPIKLVNISVSLKNSLYFVRFDVSVRESMTEDIKFEMSVKRCRNKAALDTCEEYHKYTFRNFCKMLKIPGPWISYLESFDPPYSCPTKKGKYVMKKGIYCRMKDIARLSFGDGYFYKFAIKLNGMESNKLYACLGAEGQK